MSERRSRTLVPNLRKRNGPAYLSGGRAAWEAELLARLLDEVRPTPTEMELIYMAIERWGKSDPTAAEVLGMHPREGLDSIMSLLARGVSVDEAA